MNNNISSETMKDLDIAQYMGKWHEIAKYEFKWEADCDGAVALYTWENDHVLVENQCFRKGQYVRSRTAKAWAADPADPSKLNILFNGMPRDMGVGNYWIHWTDYNNAIVGGPSGRFLWWLSRKPTVRATEVEPMLERIRSFGYDTNRLMANPSVVTK